MQFSVRFFWVLVAILLSASAYFGVGALSYRHQGNRGGARVTDGELVRLTRVVDGATLVVANEAGERVGVRLTGIRAFAAGDNDEVLVRAAHEAQQALRQKLEGVARVVLSAQPLDSEGRVLVRLIADEKDIGFELVSEGQAFVFTAYPFLAMSSYLMAQQMARSRKRGLWAEPALVKRVDLLQSAWQEERR